MGLSDYLGRFWYSSEPMFGVIMVLCFTSLLRTYPRVADEILGHVLLAALMCCIAWGIVDGVFYAWEAHDELHRKKELQEKIRASAGAAAVHAGMEDHFSDTLVADLGERDQEQVYRIVGENLPAIALGQVSLREDAITILITFGLVVGSSLVVMLPFLLVRPVFTALAVSNLSAIFLLFLMGFWREEERGSGKKIANCIAAAVIGLIITVMTVLLGG